MPIERYGEGSARFALKDAFSDRYLIERVKRSYDARLIGDLLEVSLDTPEQASRYAEHWLRSLAEAMDAADAERTVASFAMLGAGIGVLSGDPDDPYVADFALDDQLDGRERRCVLLYGSGTSGQRVFLELSPHYPMEPYGLAFPSDGKIGAPFIAGFLRLFGPRARNLGSEASPFWTVSFQEFSASPPASGR